VFPRDASVVAAGGHQVVWVFGSCRRSCSVHITNLQTQSEEKLAMPAGAVSIAEGAFSPDGATLAIPVGLGGAWPGRYPTALVLVNVRTRAVRVLPGSQQKPFPNVGTFNATWSRSGWLFYTAYGYTQILAWHPGETRALVLPGARLPRIPPPGAQGQPLPTLVAL
jgi:hypothetical protein